jgi:hypothetical protein
VSLSLKSSPGVRPALQNWWTWSTTVDGLGGKSECAAREYICTAVRVAGVGMAMGLKLSAMDLLKSNGL